ATRLQQAAMEARSYAEGSLERARVILREQEASIAKLPQHTPALDIWLASARGMIALIANDAKLAAEQFQRAYNQATALETFDEGARLTFKQRLAFAHIRLGRGARAEQLFRELIEEFIRLRGPNHPSVLRVRLNLAQALMIQNKHRQAIEEASSIYPSYVE